MIGAVSVGVLQTRVSDFAWQYLPEIAGAAALALALGAGLAWLVARRLRRQTLGLEPEEITAAYTHHDAVLHAVGEGLLVADADRRLVVVNAEARRLLGLDAGGTPREDAPDEPQDARGTHLDRGPQVEGADGSSLDSLRVDPAVRAVLDRGPARTCATSRRSPGSGCCW